MNKIWTVVIVIAVLVIGGLWLTKDGGEENYEGNANPPIRNDLQEPSGAAATGEAKTFDVSGNNFTFSLGEIRVKEGDTVRINFTNVEGRHDLRIDEFNAGTKVLAVGGKETIEFVANKKGTFEYYCSVGTHRQMGMKGNLIVE